VERTLVSPNFSAPHVYSLLKSIRRARRPLNRRGYARKLFRRQEKSVHVFKSWRRRRRLSYKRK
jgi:hypothetical protein